MYNVTSPTNSGRVIAVWSPVSRQGAASTTAALLTSYMAKANPTDKILLVSNEAHGNPTAAYYISKERMVSGLAEVIELSISENLRSAEDIYNNAFTVGENIDVLSCNKVNTNVTDFLNREISNILDMAKTGYKYIIVDTVCGQYDQSTMEILRKCDTIVVGLPQDRYIFDSWVRKMPDVYPSECSKKPLVVVSSMHYEYPDMKYRSMATQLKGEQLYYISLNDEIHGAVSGRNIPEFIGNYIKSKNPDEAIPELEAISEKIIANIESVIQKEIEFEQAEIEKTRKQTQEYLDSTAKEQGTDFFNGMDYGMGMGEIDEESSDASETEDSSTDKSGVNFAKQTVKEPEAEEAFNPLADDLYS